MGTNKKKQTAVTDDEVEKGYETQFIPQSDDDEKLWAVEEILAEKGKKYLLRWAGTDEDGKPWPNSWVPKYDVTNDLITQWKELKKKRKLDKEVKKKQRQNSVRADRTSRPPRSRSTFTASSIPSSRRTRQSSALERAESVETPDQGSRAGQSSTTSRSSPRKRKRTTPVEANKVKEEEEEGGEEEEEEESLHEKTRPRKRRRSERGSAEPASPLEQRVRRPKRFSSTDTTTMSGADDGKRVVPRLRPEDETKSASDRNESDQEMGTNTPIDYVPPMKRRKRHRSTVAAEEPEDRAAGQSGSDSGRAKSRSKSLGRSDGNNVLVEDIGPEYDYINDVDIVAPDEPVALADAVARPQIDEDANALGMMNESSQARDAAMDSSYTGTVIPETQSSRLDSTIAQPSASTQILDADSSNVMGISENHQTDSIDPLDSSQMFVPSTTLLQPLPRVTPEKFKDLVPSMRPVPRIEPERLQRIVGESGKHEADTTGPASSIETNFSPDKSKRREQHTGATQDDEIEDISMSPDTALRERGLQLAEDQLVNRREMRHKVIKRPLDELISSHSHRHSTNGACADTEEIRTPSPSKSASEAFFNEFIDLDGGAGVDDTYDNSAAVGGDDENHYSRGKNPGEGGDGVDAAQVDEDGESSMQFGGSDVMDDPNDPNADGIIRRPHTPSTATSQHEDEDDRLLATPGKFNGSLELPTHPMSHELSQIHETPARQLNSALGLLDKKSEEISELKAERSTLFERIAELESRLAAQSRPDRISQTPGLEPSDEIAVDNGLADALRQLDELQQERESLTAEVKLIKIARDDAEKNSQLFRELYGKASAFTDELRIENSALSARAVVAERQASEGVALCRATYEARVRKLTDELKKSTIRFNLVETQAQRTDDDVRRRASLFFEQESEIARLKERIESLKGDCRALKTQRDNLLVNLKTLEDQRDSWASERSTMDFEMRRMKIELARYAARERSVMQAWNMPDDDADPDTDGEPEDPGEEEVYVCQWVNDDGNWCGAALPSQQDLQDHLFVAAHL